MNVARKTIFMGNGITYVIKLIIACLLITQFNAHAGFVLGRGVINTENGDTIWAEYNADGGYLILEDIKNNDAHTVAGSTLLAYQNQWKAYQVRNPNSQYLTKAAFDSINIMAQNGKTFNKPRIPEEAKVVVLPASDKILTEQHEFIEYIWLPYDLKVMGGIPSRGGQGSVPEVSSYLISKNGSVLHESTAEGSSIGPLNGYYYPRDDKGNLILEQKEYENGALPFSSSTEDQLVNPVPGVMISGYGNKKTISSEDGWIQASSLTECRYDRNSYLGSSLGAQAASAAMMGIIYSAPPITLGARLPFTGFSATEPKQRAYFAYGLLGLCDITASNIFVSMQSVMGGAKIYNPNFDMVPLTAKTSFHLDTQRNEVTYLSSIDFDGDGEKDRSEYLKYDKEKKTYTQLDASASSEATHMGIYFTTGVEIHSVTGLEIPSIIRAVDRVPQHKDKGLLKTINSVDLAQTDLLVFRVSSGQLITSHKGIEQGTFGDDHTQGGTFNHAFNFEFAMRGPDDYWHGFNPYPDYVGWASATKVTEPFQKRNADHIRPGEQLQLIAINRSSGYIGSVKFTSKQVGVGGDINNALDSIIMRPPNLKIWAERVHEIKQGKQVAGEKESTNVIGNEGITLEDDLAVSIHTEWLDYNGLPLPAELGDYGYTARVAKITSAPTPNEDALKQNSTNEFAIKPGRNLNVLQFNQKELSRHHFYVQVNPYPKSQQNDFGSEIYNPLHKNYLPDGSGEDEHDLPSVDNIDLEGNETLEANPLRYRPAHYVPFKVPLYDEQYSQIQQDVYDDLKEQNAGNPTELAKLEKPDPLYRWYYRPELQFSQYNFDAKSLIVNQIDNDGTESTTDINIEEDGADFGPVFDSYTDSVELLFDLLGPDLDRLPALENDREFVLSLGGEEAIATIGKDGKVTFENPEHLSQLTEADLLSLRLYLNGDAGNVLWEYAFEHVVLTPNPAGVKELFVTADDNELAFNLMYMGYSSKDLKDRDIKKIKWKIDNAIGTFSPASGIGRTGSFSTVLKTVRRAGATGYLYAEGDSSSGGSSVKGPKVTVLAGKPTSIDVKSTGKTAIGGIDEINLEITVKDSYPQPVEDGTSIGISYPGNLDVEYTGSTVNGKVQVKIKGARQAGVIPIAIYSGDVSTQHNVTVDDVQLAISMDTKIEPYARETIRISAVSEGHNLEGKTLSLRSTKGSLQEQVVVIKDGVAETLLVADSAIGSGIISASFEDIVYAQENFEVDYRTAIIGIDEPVLVADQDQDGTVAVDNGFGTSIDVPYVTSTEVTVTGEEGTTEKISIGGLENPPIEPLLYYNLNRVYGDQTVGDAYGVINATIGNVARDLESFDGFKGSYAFAADSNLKIPHHNALQKDNKIGFGLKVKPTAAGIIVDYSGTSQKLTLLPNNRIQYQVETSEGLYSVESSPVELDEWHSIGVRYDSGELALEVNDEKFTAIGAGSLLTSTAGDSAATIGSGFAGSINEFKIIDWDYPLLATLPNGDIEMDVVFNSTTEKVVISSTNKMGTRPMGYLASNQFNSPFHNALNNRLFPQAYAGERFNRFLGQVKMHSQAVSYALVETGNWAVVSYIGFSNGVVYGDTSTTAGIIGDIALGFLPFGDVRDIAIQEYYYVYNTLDNNGKPKYDETILYLAYIGLGADALMLSPAVALGTLLNGAVAGTKTGMKLLDKLPAKKVLAERFKEMAEAARDRDWTRFEAITRNTLPVMQLFAAVALDEDLRNLLGSAIRNVTDLDNWAKYLKGYANQPDAVAHVSPLPKGLFDEAYAATSPFKLILKKMVQYGAQHGIDGLGPVLSDSIGTLRRAIDSDAAIAKYAYKEEAIQAMVNIHKLGGTSALERLAKFKHISIGVPGGTVVGDKRIEKMMKNFAELDLSKLPTGKNSGEGFNRILGDLVRSDSFSKGAAHAVNILKRIQKSEVDELKDLGALTHIEKYRHSTVNGGVEIRTGREDFIFGDTILELKSYNPANLRSQLVQDMKGKDNGQKGLQLFSNVLEMAEGKDIRMVFEKFDGLTAASVRKTLDEVVTNALKKDENLRAKISGWYGVGEDGLDDYIEDKIIKKFRATLDNKILVID